MMESLNDYGNILFYNFDDTQLLEYKIKSALKGLIAETFSANNIDDLIVVLKEKNISHIYLDMDMPNGWMEVVDIIRQYPMSAHTPITAVTKSSSITDSLRLELSAYEIYTILQIPFFAENVRNLFLQSMARDGMYKNSLSVQTIEALIEFFNCASYSHSLESLAKIYASQIELEPQLCKDIARCAKFLSICLVNDKTMQEGRRLLDRLRVAESLRNIFAGSPQENIATAIIYAIYNVEQTKTVTPSFGLEFGKNITVFEEIERLSALMPMIIEDSSDMRLSLEKV